MTAVKRMIDLAKRIEGKLVITAQTMGVQPDEVEKILIAAGLHGSNFDNTQVAPLLNAAGIPETVKIYTFLHLDTALNVRVDVKSDPPAAGANRLKALLQAKFGAAVTKAL